MLHFPTCIIYCQELQWCIHLHPSDCNQGTPFAATHPNHYWQLRRLPMLRLGVKKYRYQSYNFISWGIPTTTISQPTIPNQWSMKQALKSNSIHQTNEGYPKITICLNFKTSPALGVVDDFLRSPWVDAHGGELWESWKWWMNQF